MNYSRITVLITMVLGVSFFRVLPHPPNFTPVLAVALFAGAQFTDKRLAFLIPLLAMLMADLFLGLHATMIYVYGAVALTAGLGMWLRARLSISRITVAAIAASLLFFIITNFGAWLALPTLYGRSIDGLLTAYIAAIPFYQNTLVGNLLFTAALFGGFYFLERKYPELGETAPA